MSQSRREFLGFDRMAENFNPPSSLDKAAQLLQRQTDGLKIGVPKVLNPAIPESLAAEAVYSLNIPEAKGIREIASQLPTKFPGEDLINLARDTIAPIGAGLLGVAGTYASVNSLVNKGVDENGQSRGSRAGFIAGSATGLAVGPAVGIGLYKSSNEPHYASFDTPDFTRQTFVNHSLAKVPGNNEKAYHAPQLVAELQKTIKELNPNASLYRTTVDYNRTANKQTGDNFEMAFVKLAKQNGHMVVNGEERLVPQDVYMVAFMDDNGKAVARTAVATEIPDQADGSKTLILTLADENTLEPNFTKPLVQMTKWADENAIRFGYYDPNKPNLRKPKITAKAALPQNFNPDNVSNFLASLFTVSTAEAAAELVPTATFTASPTRQVSVSATGIPTADNTPVKPTQATTFIAPTIATTRPTQIATSTRTVTLEPTIAASPTPTVLPTYTQEQVGIAGVQKIENKSEWQAVARTAVEQYAKAFGIDPNSVKLTIKGYKDKTGNLYALATTSETGKTDSDGTPLLIWNKDQKNGERGWREADPGKVMNVYGKVGSITAAGGDESSGSSNYYAKTALFNGLTPPAAFSELYMGASGNPDNWLALANKNGQRVIVHAAFGKNVREGTKADEQYARQRMIDIFRALKRNNIKNPVIILANEPFYNDDYGRRNPGWNSQIPYYKDLGGTKWIENAYSIVWEVSQSDEFKLKPGIDFSIVGINGLIPIKNSRTGTINTFYLDQAANIRQNIAQKLGVSPENLPFDLGMIYYIGDPAATIKAPIPLNEVSDLDLVASQENAFVQQAQAKMKGSKLWLIEYAVNAKGGAFNQAANTISNTLTPLIANIEGFNLWMPLSLDHLGANPQKYPQFFPNYIFGSYPNFDNEASYYALIKAIYQGGK